MTTPVGEPHGDRASDHLDLAALGNRLATATATLAEHNYVIGISGIDCSGKSTIADRLADELRAAGRTVVRLSTDSFHLPRAVRNANINQAMAYYMETIDFQHLISEVIIPIRRDGNLSLTVDKRDLLSDAPYRETLSVTVPTVVVVDGCFLYRQDLPDPFDYKVWVEIDFQTSLERALVRDRPYYKSRGVIRHRYQERFMAGQQRHLKRDQPVRQADAILDGTASLA